MDVGENYHSKQGNPDPETQMPNAFFHMCGMLSLILQLCAFYLEYP